MCPNFINKAALWDYFYQFCSIFPHLVFFWYNPSLNFQVYDKNNKEKVAAEPVWSSSAMRRSPVSRGTPAMGGEDRQKAWKKADSFQEQKELFSISSAFPTPSTAHSTGPPPASCAISLSPAPEQLGRCEAQGWALLHRQKGGGGKGQPCRHPSGTSDGRCRQLCPRVLPNRLGQVHRQGQLQPEGTFEHVPKTQQWPRQGAASLASRAMCLPDLSIKSYPPWVVPWTPLTFSSLAL